MFAAGAVLGMAGGEPGASEADSPGASTPAAEPTAVEPSVGGTSAKTVYRFASEAKPETLSPNLSRAAPFTQLRVNFMMKFERYRSWRADLHMRGDTLNSPFVSVLRDPAAGAASTDPWLQTIITGKPGLSNVAKAPDLGEFSVPPSRLIGPRETNTLSQTETEMVFHGSDLAQFLNKWIKNPY
jgi:hypothetical protein